MNNSYYPGWTTVKKIGSGGFGAVYEIQRDLLGETEKAALKVITVPAEPEEIDELYGEGYDMQSLTSRYIGQRDDILREYQLMRKLNGHTHVVNCDDIQYSQHSDRLGWDIKIKMELLTPLTKLPPEHFTEEQVIKLGSDICDALALCRMNSIIHRDIKPQNIFVSDDGEYKLGDFGIARTMEHTASGTKIGTYKFMAPEVYNNQPYNATVDIYSLGLVLYWLLNGRRMPFLKPGVINPSEEEEARRRRFAGDAIPAPVYGGRELQRIVLKACEFDAKRRWQTAEEMKQALDALLYGEARSTAEEKPKRAEEPKPAQKAEVTKAELKPKAEAPKPAPKMDASKSKSVFSSKAKTADGGTKKKKSSLWLRMAVVAVCVLLGSIVGKQIGREYLEAGTSAKTQASTTQTSVSYKPAALELPDGLSAEDKKMYKAWAEVNNTIAYSLTTDKIDYFALDSFEEFSAQFAQLGEEFVFFNKNFGTWERTPEWNKSYDSQYSSTSYAINIGICDVDTEPDGNNVLKLASVFYIENSDSQIQTQVGITYSGERIEEVNSALRKIVPPCCTELEGRTESEVYEILGINEEMLEWLASQEHDLISYNNYECSVSVHDYQGYTMIFFKNNLTGGTTGQTNEMSFDVIFSDGECSPTLITYRSSQ